MRNSRVLARGAIRPPSWRRVRPRDRRGPRPRRRRARAAGRAGRQQPSGGGRRGPRRRRARPRRSRTPGTCRRASSSARSARPPRPPAQPRHERRGGARRRARRTRETWGVTGHGLLRGQLLIAGPTLLDPNFSDCLVCAHSPERAGPRAQPPVAGRRARGAARARRDARLDPAPAAVDRGPVQEQSVVLLAQLRTRRVADDRGDLGLVTDGATLEHLPSRTWRLRAFLGHSGWAGQLDAELEREALDHRPAVGGRPVRRGCREPVAGCPRGARRDIRAGGSDARRPLDELRR